MLGRLVRSFLREMNQSANRYIKKLGTIEVLNIKKGVIEIEDRLEFSIIFIQNALEYIQ